MTHSEQLDDAKLHELAEDMRVNGLLIYNSGRGKVIAGRFMCGPCIDTAHRDCEKGSCQCLCRTAVEPAPKQKPDPSLQENMDRFGVIEV